MKPYLLSGGSLNLSALDNLNLTTAADSNHTAGCDMKEWVGNRRESLANALQSIKVADCGKIWLGNESLNVLHVLLELINIVSAWAGTLQSHTHPNNTPPSQAGYIEEFIEDVDLLGGNLGSLVE